MLISCSGIFKRLKNFWNDLKKFCSSLSVYSVLFFCDFSHTQIQYMKNDGCRKSLHKIVQFVAITPLFGFIPYIIFLLS